jgi:beta-phosphoglucomutase-like phosphatase (HAD superfamily)
VLFRSFEDSRNGIRASLGANLKTVVTVNDYTRQDDFAGALAVLSDLGEPTAPYARLDQEESGMVNLARLRAWMGE